MIHLNGKNIFITGSSSGIGKATAILADKLGATVFLTGRDEARLKETQSLLEGKNHRILVADVSEEKDISMLAGSLPPLDGIVHCAGVTDPMPAKFINKKHIDKVFKTNFYSQVLLTSGLLAKARIKKNASVVLISSVSTEQPYFGGAMYMSSKAAVNAFCKALAFELSPQKIRVNCISPALVKTKIYDDMKAAVSPANLEEYEKKYPLGLGEAMDVANMAVFLLSDASRWMTGTNIILDGGLLLDTK